jgi:hypothetical protein
MNEAIEAIVLIKCQLFQLVSKLERTCCKLLFEAVEMSRDAMVSFNGTLYIEVIPKTPTAYV